VPSPLWSSIDGAVSNTSFLNANVFVPCFLGTDTSATNTLNRHHRDKYPRRSSQRQTAESLTPALSPTPLPVFTKSMPVIPESSGTGSVVSYPLTITVGTGGTAVSSQSGVTMWVK